LHDDDHDDYDGFEPGDDDDHLPVDVPLPDYVAALEPTTTLVELAAAYAKTKKKDDRNERLRFAIDHDWYKIMLGRMMIARLSYEHFSARRITSKDGAAVMAAYDEFGKKHCNVERAQWRKYLRLSKSIGEIHEHTLAMQKEQAAAGKRLTFPSLNMLDREWFPADPDAAEFREIKRQAARRDKGRDQHPRAVARDTL
jgi:hypothetical protein